MRKTKPVQSRTVIYGVHPVLETIIAGRRSVEKVYVAREPSVSWNLTERLEAAGISLTRVSSGELNSIAGSTNHQGIAALVGPYPYVDFEKLLDELNDKQETVVVLDEVQDPANLGNILRSCECLGAGAVILSKNRAVPITAAVEKASAGASSHVQVARVVNLVRAVGQLKEANYWVYGADARAQVSLFSVDLTGKSAFVMGSEGAGIRRLVREKCDQLIKIPMLGKIDSLNVSQSVAIILAEMVRQRLEK